MTMSNEDITTITNAISKLQAVNSREYDKCITFTVQLRSGVVKSMLVNARHRFTSDFVDVGELERIDLFNFLGIHYGHGVENTNYNLTVFTEEVITMIEEHYPNLHRITTIDEILADLA